VPNEAFGWLSVLCGLVIGVYLGIRFQREDWLGGLHVSVLSEETAMHADAVAIGEGELLWPGILNDFRHNRLLPSHRLEQRISLSRKRRNCCG
jgi:hypothetical protein